MSALTPDQEATKRAAYRRADLEMLPAELADALKEVQYWETKQQFWSDKLNDAYLADHLPPWAGTAERKSIEVKGILELMRENARNIQAKLQ